MTFRAVFVTVPSIEIAKSLASGLVSKKLAACVNIIPQITSVYEWEGKVNEDSELLLMIKTQSHLFDELSTYVKGYSFPKHSFNVDVTLSLNLSLLSRKSSVRRPWSNWTPNRTRDYFLSGLDQKRY